jgi:hypothetical protein
MSMWWWWCVAIVFWCHDGEKTKYSNSAARWGIDRCH